MPKQLISNGKLSESSLIGEDKWIPLFRSSVAVGGTIEILIY